MEINRYKKIKCKSSEETSFPKFSFIFKTNNIGFFEKMHIWMKLRFSFILCCYLELFKLY